MRIHLCLMGLLLALTVSGAELRFNFGETPVGAMPTNFSSVRMGGGAPGVWRVAQDAVPSAFAPLTEKAPQTSIRSVLAQTSQDLADERFPMLVYDAEIFRNFKFTTRFKMVSGVNEQMAGVVFRWQNASNFYVVRVSALGKNLRFYKVVDGLRSDPIGPALAVAAGEWHTLAVKCEGNQITIWLDGQPAMPALGDNTFSEGKVGFWTKSDAVSYFADAELDYTPRVAAAQVMVNSVMEKQSRLLGLRIYAQEAGGATRVIASKDGAENGQPGTEAEKAAIQDGTISIGWDDGAVLLTLPLHDRNGDIIGAMRVKLKSFLGETQDNALTRATKIKKLLEAMCLAAEDLRK